MTYLLQEMESNGAAPERVVVIQNRSYCLPEVSQTFHGRDIFAPVAAHLSLGVPLDDIGPPAQHLVRFSVPRLKISENTLTGEIIKIDSFGNAITSISENLLLCLGSKLTEDSPSL